MKVMLTSLVLLAVAGMAVAQTPGLPIGAQPKQPVYGAPVQPIYGTPVQATLPVANVPQPVPQSPSMHSYSIAPASNAPMSPAACCNCAPCCEQVTKVCIQEPAIKKVPHTFYSKVCEEFCVPKCSCLSCFGCFGCGGCSLCDGPRTKYYLVKRVVVDECPTTKCVLSVMPACGECATPACGCATPGCGTTVFSPVPAQTVQPMPLPMPK